MIDKEFVERLREKAEWARCNEWETPLCLADDLTAAADAIKRLKSELTQEKIDNTNLIGELATVAAERDRYKAERDAAVRDLCQLCKKEAARIGCETLCNRCAWRGLEENT